MYDLPYFKESDQRTVLDFIRQHPFAMLIGVGESAPVATQVPVLIDEREGEALFLRGHIMRNTDHHKAFQRNSEALCVFSGAHAYVSASWYSNPLTGSTWNYISVHARGKIRFLEEPELRLFLEKLTAHFENNDDSPALFRHLPKSYVDSLVKAIVAFEIEVRETENVFKLSQNRDEQSYDNIIRQLHVQGGDARTIADEMRKRKARVFAQDRPRPNSSP
ncbi:MAG TPA: FMN-binding negative transcriptional regulator [Chthoniobacterales bacterium]|jgi:transcriptional regulator